MKERRCHVSKMKNILKEICDADLNDNIKFPTAGISKGSQFIHMLTTSLGQHTQ